jgi:hypothetical protein
MASIVVSGDTSGAVTLSAPSVAGTTTVTLPSSTGTMALLQTPSFATTIGVGGATASASGSGISFPATQSASSDANTLDDYEEGTWTPSVTSLGGTITTVGAVSGKYTKVGRIVVVNYDVAITTQGTGASAIQIAGLPFSNGDTVSVSCGREVNLTGYITSGILATSGTTISVRYYDATYPGASGSRNQGTLTYQTT